MKKITINVTARDIKNGLSKIWSGASCPIHEAAERKIPGVYVYWTGLGLPGGRVVDIPASAIQFQRQAKNHHKVKPFRFTVEI